MTEIQQPFDNRQEFDGTKISDAARTELTLGVIDMLVKVLKTSPAYPHALVEKFADLINTCAWKYSDNDDKEVTTDDGETVSGDA